MKAAYKLINFSLSEEAKYIDIISKIGNKIRFSSDEWSFYPTEEDWQLIKNQMHCIILNITPRCNSSCNICYMKNTHKFEDMNIESIKNILKKIGKNKIVVLFGGEPTVRDDIFEIIKLIRRSGNKPELYTNGLKLSDLNYVERLKEAGIVRIHFSFDGFKKNIYEKLRGDQNQFYIKLRALYNLMKLNMETFLSSTIVYGINDDQISVLLNFCITSVQRKNFIKGIRFFTLVPYGKFEINVDKFVMPIDIIKVLEECTGGSIRREYFIEFKKLLVNLNRLLDGLLYFPIGNISPYTLFEVDKYGIKDLIELDFLKKINFSLERKGIKKIVSLMKLLIKNKKIFKYALRFVTGNSRAVFRDKTLMISVGFVKTPITNYFGRDDTIGIAISEKFGKLKPICYAQSTVP